MAEYKSKYAKKGLSIYGEPNIVVLNKIIEHSSIKPGDKILIPNCQDGIDVLPLVKRKYNITCYEENSILINGGCIDNFYTIGLNKRIEGINKKVNLFNENFYKHNVNEKYNLVLAIRTLQLKENNKYSIANKIKKLKSCVKDNGYIYLTYYLGDDHEISKRQIIMKGQIKRYFNSKEWNVIYYRENDIRITKHNKHPYNKKEHYHNVGTILVQRVSHKYHKRVVNRTYRKGSIYGDASQQVYDYINFLKNEYKRILDILIVDANDGKNVIPFAKNGFNVTCYEDNNILLNGGLINNKKTAGLKKRIKDYNLESNVIVNESNYYKHKDVNKYDFIYIENSLNLEKNNGISMKNKVRQLMANVREGGYLYIYYNLSINLKKDNSLLDYGEMKKYFDLESWNILYICERNEINYCNNKSNDDKKIGYILAKKKKNRIVHKNYYSIEINNSY